MSYKMPKDPLDKQHILWVMIAICIFMWLANVALFIYG
jgi:hypothetical protein